ncbi:MAG: hypothetical protein M1472_03365 [Planctomycetes bacterium]|jgi:hypothetical protein|nr:hypothetical protein [Planctomycetota bacterium]
MRFLFCIGISAALLSMPGVCAAMHRVPSPRIVRALLWQARQYTYIKTIHFVAIERCVLTPKRGQTVHGRARYKYWGSGKKYRIDYWQFMPQADFRVVITDNGRHFRMLDRITGQLIVTRTHPIHGAAPVPENPILAPLVPLAPYFPHRLNTPHKDWVNLVRFARNPNSIFSRCREVAPCGPSGPAGVLHGCISGAFNAGAARIRFTVAKGRWPHSLVTSWTAEFYQHPGNYVHMRIKYRAFHLASGRRIYLPAAYREKGMYKNLPWPMGGAGTNNFVVTHVILNKPIPAGTFTIDYKLARYILDRHNGKYTTIPIHPARKVQGGAGGLK